MSDLVERLRDHSIIDDQAVGALRERAASEIERLRKALREVVECDNALDLTPYDYMHGNEAVRAVIRQAKETLGMVPAQDSPAA